jgi:hypothetical protein
MSGRLLVSGFIGFCLTSVFIVLALLGVTLFPRSVASPALSVPLLPGLSFAALLHTVRGGTEELAAALYFNAVVYSVLVFGIWQRRINRLRRRTVLRPHSSTSSTPANDS